MRREGDGERKGERHTQICGPKKQEDLKKKKSKMKRSEETT